MQKHLRLAELYIDVGLCFYNDLGSLKHSVPTYQENVRKIHAIDGRFQWFESDKDYSDPEVIEYLQSFDNVEISQFVGLEHDKRNQYVKLAGENKADALLIIDSDDYVLEADWDLFYKSAEERIKQYPTENFFGVEFRYTPPNYPRPEYTPYPRLWARPNECEYYKAHCIFRGKNGGPTRSSSRTPKIDGLRFASGDDYRSTEYLQKISKYQGRMISYEIPVRHALRDGLPI